jgi:magnesium chelatase subunit I
MSRSPTASLPSTLGELRCHPRGARQLVLRSVKDEMRGNLLKRLSDTETLFPGLIGYDETVVPQLVNAILARHNFILLGLRGQAKSRILRSLETLLDDAIPIVAGSEVNDNPYAPISKYAARLIDEAGEDTPIAWLERGQRYVEKLATPDVTIADIIGDVDPIKAAKGGHVLSDELTMHFGMLPRANRGIFALNELPDLAGKVQVGLFNIMQEGDVQVKGYPVRLRLDVLLCFTANPEDYTARGKIITPLKDRIGSEIGTHYPESLDGPRHTPAARAAVRRRSHRARCLRGAHRQAHRSPFRRVATHADQRARERGFQRRAPVAPVRRIGDRAAPVRRVCRAAVDHRQAGAGV